MKNKILCVWQGTILGDNTVADFIKFFKDTFDIEIEYAEEVKTLGSVEHDEEGGRTDQLFWVKNSNIGKFATKRLQYGIRWWEDIFFNNQEYQYSQEILAKYPNPCPGTSLKEMRNWGN